MTDPVAGFPPRQHAPDGATGTTPEAGVSPTCARELHNPCAIPVFVGIPAAASLCAGSAARRYQYGWAAYGAGSTLGMAGTCVLFGVAFAGAP